jgi:hypothetical protein
MEVHTNEDGQMLIYLSEDEWRDYGRQAGYSAEIVKEASAEVEEPKTEEVKEEVTVASLQSKIEALSAEIAQMKQAGAGVPAPEVVEEETGNPTTFNEQNYPNLFAEQQQDGLVGVFAPRP